MIFYIVPCFPVSFGYDRGKGKVSGWCFTMLVTFWQYLDRSLAKEVFSRSAQVHSPFFLFVMVSCRKVGIGQKIGMYLLRQRHLLLFRRRLILVAFRPQAAGPHADRM